MVLFLTGGKGGPPSPNPSSTPCSPSSAPTWYSGTYSGAGGSAISGIFGSPQCRVQDSATIGSVSISLSSTANGSNTFYSLIANTLSFTFTQTSLNTGPTCGPTTTWTVVCPRSGGFGGVNSPLLTFAYFTGSDPNRCDTPGFLVTATGVHQPDGSILEMIVIRSAVTVSQVLTPTTP